MDKTVVNIVDCNDEQSNCPQVPEKGLFEPPLSMDAAQLALAPIKLVLKPHRDMSTGDIIKTHG
jgi:hypothetical protein